MLMQIFDRNIRGPYGVTHVSCGGYLNWASILRRLVSEALVRTRLSIWLQQRIYIPAMPQILMKETTGWKMLYHIYQRTFILQLMWMHLTRPMSRQQEHRNLAG